MKIRVFAFATIIFCLFSLTCCSNENANSKPSNQLNELKQDAKNLKIEELQNIIKDKDTQVRNLQKDIESLNYCKNEIRGHRGSSFSDIWVLDF